MNTIEEILKSKKRKTLSEETIYETYKRVLCKDCSNRENSKDLCKITITQDRKAKCYSYEKYIKNKCHGCSKEKECFEESEKYVSKSN